ncbi:hypothetical protein ABEB36_001138 [Hypothenemus hampei]|uniref:Ectonucleotide pyrophosphatase/phosphodiesterase family member 5 n=1 Tax=Hypothenemus hampei TaxID=57062 RepID=A0ABD1FH57_HYPHA
MFSFIMWLLVLQFFAIFLLFQVNCLSKHPILIVVSYDAFRYNFFESEELPNMEEVRHRGVYADHLINVFPTKTFPNHHTIATGLYTEVHGVIGNSFYDPLLKRIVTISPDMYNYNDNVIPIWRLNEDFEDERYSGSMMWPGGDFFYQNKAITWSMPFHSGSDWYKRIDQALAWIQDPFKPANLVMIYFEEPDTHGHAFGPNSPTVKNLIKKLDNITGYLHQKLKDNDLTDKVNVIHVSDHGMTAVSPPKFVNITQYLTNGTYEWAGASPAIQIIPHDGYEDGIYNALKAESEKHNYKVYKKSEYLTRWHYGNNRRAPPILVMANVGYALDDLIISAPKYALKYNFTLTNQSEFGVHGYDYTDPEMHPYFMAVGPKIKQKVKVNPFHTIDLFNLFCVILDLPPTKNNGTMLPSNEILIQYGYATSTIIMISVGAVVLVLVLISMAVIFTLMLIKRQQNITTTAALNKRFPQTFQNYIEAQHLLDTEEA